MAGRAPSTRPSMSANRLYTVALDGQIRRYGADGKLEAKAPAHGGAAALQHRRAPARDKLAIGFNDTTAVEVYDAPHSEMALCRRYERHFGRRSEQGRLGPPMARGFMREAGTLRPMAAAWRSGKTKAGVPAAEAALSQNTVMQLLPCGDGIAAGAQDPAFGLIAADGGKRVWQEGVTADMRNKLGDAFTLSANGKLVRFGLGEGAGQPVLFDLGGLLAYGCAGTVPGLTAAQESRASRSAIGRTASFRS